MPDMNDIIKNSQIKKISDIPFGLPEDVEAELIKKITREQREGVKVELKHNIKNVDHQSASPSFDERQKYEQKAKDQKQLQDKQNALEDMLDKLNRITPQSSFLGEKIEQTIKTIENLKGLKKENTIYKVESDIRSIISTTNQVLDSKKYLGYSVSELKKYEEEKMHKLEPKDKDENYELSKNVNAIRGNIDDMKKSTLNQESEKALETFVNTLKGTIANNSDRSVTYLYGVLDQASEILEREQNKLKGLDFTCSETKNITLKIVSNLVDENLQKQLENKDDNKSKNCSVWR